MLDVGGGNSTTIQARDATAFRTPGLRVLLRSREISLVRIHNNVFVGKFENI